jgi:hypothetical protein
MENLTMGQYDNVKRVQLDHPSNIHSLCSNCTLSKWLSYMAKITCLVECFRCVLQPPPLALVSLLHSAPVYRRLNLV